MVEIEIDGKKFTALPGQMIIEVADKVNIPIPRFCYHKELSIAANCRMCLVEVANAPKPLPACATPIAQGMKIFTQSAKAKDSQKAVMEFLLINHPLDCPICDQGGQCELQDVALEYGKDYSRYDEGKRVVKDKNIGPLISTEMTRCIHCTRCVRFGTEVAGVREFGGIGRGEFTEISTFIEKSVDSELSGNVIDLCPVGALTSKPFRFKARAWELQSRPSISPHGCIGANIYYHVYQNKVMRALPRENEQINEVWLADRDRFGYEGLNHPSRLTQPLMKQNNEWQTVDWSVALNAVNEKIQHTLHQYGPTKIGALISPNATNEEFYLLQKYLRQLGCHNIDHRLRQLDTSYQDKMGPAPTLGIGLKELESANAILLVGSNIRKEEPLLAQRLRKAQLRGSKINAINPWLVEFNFALNEQLVDASLMDNLLSVIKSTLSILKQEVVPSLKLMMDNVSPTEQSQSIANELIQAEKSCIILGMLSLLHPQAGLISYLSRYLAEITRSNWGQLSEGANTPGGHLMGALPHRQAFGQPSEQSGLSVQQMFNESLKTYLLFNCEPEYDCANPFKASQALKEAETVIAFSLFDSPHLREYADIILPLTANSEMSGTFVNITEQWQAFDEVTHAFGESKPGWKIMRVLGNLAKLSGFEYETIYDVRSDIIKDKKSQTLKTDSLLSVMLNKAELQFEKEALVRYAPVPLYANDSIIRRANALQKTHDANISIRVHPEFAKLNQLESNESVWVEQDNKRSLKTLPITLDDNLPLNVIILPQGIEATRSLNNVGLIKLVKAMGASL